MPHAAIHLNYPRGGHAVLTIEEFLAKVDTRKVAPTS